MRIEVRGLLSLLVLVADFWAIVSVVSITESIGVRVLWVLLILLLPLLGFFIWLFAGPGAARALR